jgi:hypothetical protein
MDDTWDSPLSVLGADLTATEWARRAGCSTRDVRARATALGVALAGDDEETMLARAMRVVREVECE